MPKPIRVVVVDDSALVRDLLREALSRETGIEVAGTARDPFEAREVIRATNPDVITLDIEMPRMDGIAFLERIMTLRPTPVIMVSSLTRDGADATIRALELGAVDCVAKPDGASIGRFQDMVNELVAKIRVAATARMAHPPVHRPAGPAKVSAGHRPGDRPLIAIGASTGGVERIREILTSLPADAPPLVVTQHIGAGYVASFAARLDRLSAVSVAVATEGCRLRPGTVSIAPGDRHLEVARDGTGFLCRLRDDPPVSGHRPSVDVLFQSVADAAGAGAVGVILSGMGRDGANGLLAMRAAGAYTIGETESSCVVYGMPRVARDLGAVVVELPIAHITAEILKVADTVGER